MSDIVPDCLVMKIEEYEYDTNELDTTLYILYDVNKNHYVLRGKRNAETDEPFSFIAIHTDDLADFISYIISERNLWTTVLYNYDNLPNDSNDITFEFLKENDSREYEIAGYEKERYKRRHLIRNLRMLRNIFNYY
jgi:hypothetical protein